MTKWNAKCFETNNGLIFSPMARNHENPGLPESSNTHNADNSSNTLEWRPPHQVGNGRIDRSAAEKELNTNL